MLEPLFGLAVCVATYLGVWLFAKLTTEFTPDRGFERWCASQPVIIAVRCRDAFDVRLVLRTILAPHMELVNLQGGVPWQYYRYDVDVRALADDVVTVHIVDAIPQRGSWTRRIDVADVVRLLAARAEVGEVWMHGQLRPSEARSAVRDQRSWLVRPGDEGALEATPMIGRPRWIDDAAPDP